MNRKWEEFWERHAPDDFMRTEGQLSHPARKMIYDTASSFGNSVLDVGCATGIDYLGFVEHGMKYVGVDITPKFISKFKELHPEADARVHSSLSLPFPDESFHVVHSAGMIQHMDPDDYPKAIREMWRTCKNALIITTGKPFTKKRDVIQKVNKKRVYDNHYNLVTFMKTVHSLPRFKTIKFHKNIKATKVGGPVTVVVITKDAKQ